MDAPASFDFTNLPAAPAPVLLQKPDEPKLHVGKFVLLLILSSLVVLAVLKAAFAFADPVKSDHTDGRISRGECDALVGEIIKLPTGRSACKIESGTFSLYGN